MLGEADSDLLNANVCPVLLLANLANTTQNPTLASVPMQTKWVETCLQWHRRALAGLRHTNLTYTRLRPSRMNSAPKLLPILSYKETLLRFVDEGGFVTNTRYQLNSNCKVCDYTLAVIAQML